MLTHRTWRRLVDALLLPVALVVVVFEDVVWAGALAVLRGAVRLPLVQRLQGRMAGLSGYAALPLFLVPEALGRVGEIWAVLLLAQGHARSAVLVYVLVRLLATLLAVFVYQACEPALLRIPWFAVLVRWVHAVRDWAMARIRPMQARLRAMARMAPGLLSRRFAALRRRIRARGVLLFARVRR